MVKHYARDVICLIYVLDYRNYKKELEDGFYKYLFKFVTPMFMPKKIDTMCFNKDKRVHIVGINLRKVNYQEEEILNEFISKLLKIKSQNQGYLYLEDMDGMDKKILKVIEKETGMKIPTGLDIKIFNIPLILEEISNLSKRNIRDSEVLIIGENKDQLLNTINQVAHLLRFISLIGIDQAGQDEIYQEVLETTGLSILQPKKYESDLKKYDVIINLSDKQLVDVSRIKRESIVFDLSLSKNLTSIKNPLVISDISIACKGETVGSGHPIANHISSGPYQFISNGRKEKFHRVYIKDRYYDLKEFFKINRPKGTF